MTLYEFSILSMAICIPLLLSVGAKLMFLDDEDDAE